VPVCALARVSFTYLDNLYPQKKFLAMPLIADVGQRWPSNTITDFVNVERMGGIPNFSNFLPVHSFWCIQSTVLTVKNGLTVSRPYFSVFCVSKKHATFK